MFFFFLIFFFQKEITPKSTGFKNAPFTALSTYKRNELLQVKQKQKREKEIHISCLVYQRS
jgi:hypothetical protein